MPGIDNCRIVHLPKITDPRGNLTFIESTKHVPFEIQRAYWIYDVPGGEVRGGHAYRNLEEMIIALSGSFDIAIDDGTGSEQIYHLNRSYDALYVPQMTWRQLRHFSTNSVALILASLPYSEEDYIYNYNDFLSSRVQ
jgi:hypothetical protein